VPAQLPKDMTQMAGYFRLLGEGRRRGVCGETRRQQEPKTQITTTTQRAAAAERGSLSLGFMRMCVCVGYFLTLSMHEGGCYSLFSLFNTTNICSISKKLAASLLLNEYIYVYKYIYI